jgi:uncharacterized RDD family membrane protein YckC
MQDENAERDIRSGAAVQLMRAADRERTTAPETASPRTRTLARLIDFGVFIAFAVSTLYVHSLVGLAVLGGEDDPIHGREDAKAWEIAYVAAGPVLVLLAWTAHEAGFGSRTGQTIGKRLMGAHVLDVCTALPPSRAKMAGRFLAWAAPCLALALLALFVRGPLGTLFSFLSLVPLAIGGSLVWSPGARGWHDRWFGTAVVVPRHGYSQMKHEEALAVLREAHR